nr:hypothetical protein [Corallococcus llansteffanensis]
MGVLRHGDKQGPRRVTLLEEQYGLPLLPRGHAELCHIERYKAPGRNRPGTAFELHQGQALQTHADKSTDARPEEGLLRLGADIIVRLAGIIR